MSKILLLPEGFDGAPYLGITYRGDALNLGAESDKQGQNNLFGLTAHFALYLCFALLS